MHKGNDQKVVCVCKNGVTEAKVLNELELGKIKIFLKPCSGQINVDCLAKICLLNPYIFFSFSYHE